MATTNISVQLYSVRDAVAEDLPAALARLAAIGLECVELYGFVDDASTYAGALRAAGLRAPSAHAPIISMSEPSRAFDAAETLGVSTLIDPYFEPGAWLTEAGIREVANRLNDLSAAAPRGLAIGYHNHAFELRTKIGARSALEVLADLLDPSVVIEVDTFWAAVAGVDVPDLLRSLGSRVSLIHVKDGPLTEDDDDQLPAGHGAMNQPALLAAAPSAMRVIEFDGYRGDPFDGIAASFAYLRAVEPDRVAGSSHSADESVE